VPSKSPSGKWRSSKPPFSPLVLPTPFYENSIQVKREERAAKGKTAEASRLAAENKRLEPRSRAEAPEWLRHNLWVQRLRGQT
jgi:hypothetical protein